MIENIISGISIAVALISALQWREYLLRWRASAKSSAVHREHSEDLLEQLERSGRDRERAVRERDEARKEIKRLETNGDTIALQTLVKAARVACGATENYFRNAPRKVRVPLPMSVSVNWDLNPLLSELPAFEETYREVEWRPYVQKNGDRCWATQIGNVTITTEGEVV